MLRSALAVTAGKLSAGLIQSFQVGSGTSLPGKVALKIDRQLLNRLSRQIRQQTVAISGTNGKSTTAGLLSAFIEASGASVVHNQLGANMLPGITAALLKESSLIGRLNKDYGVLEIDEASLPGVAKLVHQDLTVVTNLFRDQLDRFGELDTTAKLIRQGIENSGGALALNADDPMVASIGRHFSAERVIYYGVDAVDYPNAKPAESPVPFPKEVTDCPVCQTPLRYDKLLYGHLGHYDCPQCDFKRPSPALVAETINIETQQSTLSLRWKNNVLPPVTLALPGLFNAYNALAAATAAYWLNLPPETLESGVKQYHSIFGRAERREIDGKPVMIFLIKNPMGASEVLNVVTADPQGQLVIMINDNYADGRDISWLWDAPFEMLADSTQPIIVSGNRADDMAVRLYYAGVSPQRIQTVPDIMQAFQQGLQNTKTNQTLYVLPTYTVLLQLSQELKSR